MISDLHLIKLNVSQLKELLEQAGAKSLGKLVYAIKLLCYNSGIVPAYDYV